MPRPTFYFDLGSPYAYLAAERIAEILGEVDWQPISLGALFKLNGRSSWALADAQRRSAGMAEVAARAQRYGLAPVRWPDPWPGDYLTAMRAATFAQQMGLGPQFATLAFRHAFTEGHDLSVPERVFDAAADAGLDPEQTRAATEDPTIKLALRQATDRAHALGVFGVPTIAVAAELYWGEDRLQEAATHAAANLHEL